MSGNYLAWKVSLEEATHAAARHQRLGRRVGVASGGFDPLHPGHVGYLIEASKRVDILIVLVNGDGFLTRKKGRPFMTIDERLAVVAGVKGVEFVVEFDDGTQTVDSALDAIRPDAFLKGGDRCDAATIPEWETCRSFGIRVETGVGPDKLWRSSDILRRNGI